MSLFSKPRFAYLDARTQFSLNNVPKTAIYDELLRTYEMDVYVQPASPEGGWPDLERAGHLQVKLLRFDVAFNLGADGYLAADAQSDIAVAICELMENENGPLGLGANTDLSCLLVANVELDPAYHGTTVEHEAIRTALIGLSTGVTRAFLDLGAEAAGDVRAAQAGAERYSTLGFTPVKLGSRLLTIDMDLQKFWES